MLKTAESEDDLNKEESFMLLNVVRHRVEKNGKIVTEKAYELR